MDPYKRGPICRLPTNGILLKREWYEAVNWLQNTLAVPIRRSFHNQDGHILF